MNNFRKMVLVPQDILNNISLQRQLNPASANLNKLDQNMENALKTNDEPDEVKLKNFNQMMRMFNVIREQETKKPMKIEIAEEGGIRPLSSDNIIKSIPAPLKQKAKTLLEHVERIPNIKWDNLGRLVIDRTPIDNSDMRTLIDYYVRAPTGRRNLRIPTGWNEFNRNMEGTNPPEMQRIRPAMQDLAARRLTFSSPRLMAPIPSSSRATFPAEIPSTSRGTFQSVRGRRGKQKGGWVRW